MFLRVFNTDFEGFYSYLPRCDVLGVGRDLHCSGLGTSRLSQLLPFRLSHILSHLLDFCEVVLRFDFHEGMLLISLLSHLLLLPSEDSRHSGVKDFAFDDLIDRLLP